MYRFKIPDSPFFILYVFIPFNNMYSVLYLLFDTKNKTFLAQIEPSHQFNSASIMMCVQTRDVKIWTLSVSDYPKWDKLGTFLKSDLKKSLDLSQPWSRLGLITPFLNHFALLTWYVCSALVDL